MLLDLLRLDLLRLDLPTSLTDLLCLHADHRISLKGHYVHQKVAEAAR